MANELIEKARAMYEASFNTSGRSAFDPQAPQLMADFARSQMTEWVATSERLPENYQEIWVQYDDGDIEDAIQQKDIVMTQDADCPIVAWMPKLKPPPYQPQPAGEPAQDTVKGEGK